ncbi:alpha/beta hydrolase [Youngiibacter multivorans]|uniref:Phospholipase/carboxylesterase n=1 Tax=Youngiibacter multivorans TaxID=937251 RepID=A0ABS4G2G8_9CLOT|nr:alpha/beta hydrolase [Youngiibacter multivorans]MBP1918747.1 phospholipase/carboxylesterase [Youngiibacter multivorans]
MVHYYKKAAEGKKTFLLLHGTGGDEMDLVPLANMIDDGNGILSIRGAVIENGMNRFFKRFGEGVFDEDDIRQRAGEISEFIQEASIKYSFQPDELIALGYSNGANMIAAMLLLEAGIFRKSILYHPMVPLAQVEGINLDGSSVFISAGTNDPIVTGENSKRLYELLKENGADVTIKWFQKGHTLTTEEVKSSKEWLFSQTHT